MRAERTLNSETVYSGRLVDLRIDDVELASGRQARREIVAHRDAVAIVAVASPSSIVLVRQYRKAVDRFLLEVPAGVIEPGEEPSQCAHRELEEETGYRAGKLEYLGGFYTSPGFCTEYMHLFLATELEPGRRAPEADEAIEVVQAPLSQIADLISSGEICDAKSIVGLLRLASRG